MNKRLLAALAAILAPAAAHPANRPLALDDVLGVTAIDRVALSPDGAWAAVTTLRPARNGEVYGRTNYELDTSRADVWLVSRTTAERRNLTQGAPAAAGFWCASWSPDGRRLAMLATAPEGAEPRGGDNVRVYIWEQATGALRRLAPDAVMTQTRLGTGLYRMSLTPAGSTVPQRCSTGYENAPFVWLDAQHLLVATLPKGAVSGLIDEQGRAFRHMAATAAKLSKGGQPTFSAVGSGAERTTMDEASARTVLKTFDVAAGRAETIASVPVYPFAGELSVRVAPDGRRLAIMATATTIPPAADVPIPLLDDGWLVERRLGFADLAAGSPVHWVTMSATARYPLDLLDWSPDGRRVALRARNGQAERSTPLYVARADDLAVERVAPEVASVGGTSTYTTSTRRTDAIWVDDRRLVVQATSVAGARGEWWLADLSAGAKRLDAGETPPPRFHLFGGGLSGVAGDKLVRLDAAAGMLAPAAGPTLPRGARILQPEGGAKPGDPIVVAARGADGAQTVQLLPQGTARPAPRSVKIPAGAEIVDVDPRRGAVIWREPTPRGVFLHETSLADGRSRELLALNAHLAKVRWGETRVIDYRGADGQALKAGVILPPGYRAGQRYPVVTWVYGGHMVSGLDDYWLDRYMPGFYNLQLYAARGYVVLVPSMPLKRTGKNAHLTELTKGVLPAVDRLVELGIADAERIGVMGQSYGGFSVMGLATQTNRFKAGVALAGISDLTAFYYGFDPTARGYPGVEHEKSLNPPIAEVGAAGLGAPPYEDPSLYWRGSPLSHADRVETPLLLVHGEFDGRGNLGQAETFFSALQRQGKTARLLRYWGENHALATSPANIRSVFEESVAWFDRYLRAQPAQARR